MGRPFQSWKENKREGAAWTRKAKCQAQGRLMHESGESVLVLVDFKNQNRYRPMSMRPYKSPRSGPNAFLWDGWRMSSPQSLAGGKLPLWAAETTGDASAGAQVSA